MIEADPYSMFSWNYFLKGDGHEAYWDKKWTSEQCSVLIDGELYDVCKHGPGSGEWSLEQEGQLVTTARKRSAFKRSFQLESKKGSMDLISYSAFTRGFFLGKQEQVIANFIPRNPFTRKARIEVLDPELDFPTTVFAFWLVIVCWRRQKGAAGG